MPAIAVCLLVICIGVAAWAVAQVVSDRPRRERPLPDRRPPSVGEGVTPFRMAAEANRPS